MCVLAFVNTYVAPPKSLTSSRNIFLFRALLQFQRRLVLDDKDYVVAPRMADRGLCSCGCTLSVNYLVDCFKEMSGDALTSVILIRNTMSFAIGYGITPWLKNMGKSDRPLDRSSLTPHLSETQVHKTASYLLPSLGLRLVWHS